MRKLVLAAVAAGILSIVAVAIAAAHDDHGSGEWPTSCVDLNDIVEAHLGNDHNVGIYQRTFGDQAEQACQDDHRDDVRSVFAWAIGSDGSTSSPSPEAETLGVQSATPEPGPDPEKELVTVLTASGTGSGFTEPFFTDGGAFQIVATVSNNEQSGNVALFKVGWRSRPNPGQGVTYHHSNC